MCKRKRTKTILQSLSFVTYNKQNAPTYYWLFDPHSAFFHRWDLITVVLLTFTALVTPYEVSFCKTRYDALFYINRIVDVCFSIDILFNFFLPFKTSKGIYETSNFVVAKQYLTTWFLIDLVSILPLETIVPHLGFSGQASNLKLVRIIRLLKMAKLLRVLRAGRMLQRAEAALEVDYATMELVKFIVFVFLNAHWLACLWHMVPVMEDKEENWITSYGFLDESAGNFAKYLCSFYWAVATLSTLGYGDVVPTTHVERMFAIVATVMGASIYSYIIGTCCGLVAGMGEQQQAFYKKMDVLNHFMADKGLSPQLQERLRDYFRFRHSSSHGNPECDSRLLLDMSPALRAEVTTYTHSVWINKVQMWKDCTEEFRMRIATALTPLHFSAEEYLIEVGSWNTTLYVVERGIVATAGRLCLAGTAFGTDMLEEPQQRTYCAFSLSNVVVLSLEREKMQEIILDFPEVRIKMRKAAIKRIAREHIIAYSKAVHYSLNNNVSSTELAEKFGDSVLPVIYTHKMNTMKINEPEEYERTVKATIHIQRVMRSKLARKRVAGLRTYMTRTPQVQLGVVQLLFKTGLTENIPKFQQMKITIFDLQKISVEGLRLMTGIPCGDCYRLIQEAKKAIKKVSHSQKEDSLPAPTPARRLEKARTFAEHNMGTHRKRSFTSLPAAMDEAEAAFLNRILDEEPHPQFETSEDCGNPEESMIPSLMEHTNLDAPQLSISKSPLIDLPDGHDDERNMYSLDP